MTNLRLLALCALAACAAEPSTQVLTGHVAASRGALAVRAVADGEVVAATPVRSDGSFTIQLPEGKRYRLEVLTNAGVKNVVATADGTLRDVAFTVCDAQDPYDVGEMGDPTTGMCNDPNDPNCKPPDGEPPCGDPPPECQPGDPNCERPPGCEAGDPNCEPPKCDPMTDPNCGDPCYPQADGTCCPVGDPNCEPPPVCDPMTDPTCKCDEYGNCWPDRCQDPSDPNCGGCMDPSDPNCGGGCTDPNDPSCGGGCQADGTCPPCEDPMDPNSCDDPCVRDPGSCGCKMDEPNCWPPPVECDADANGVCDPGDGMSPDNVPGDFGCKNE